MQRRKHARDVSRANSVDSSGAVRSTPQMVACSFICSEHSYMPGFSATTFLSLQPTRQLATFPCSLG